ncbi:MAG: Gfo/Idh/MocA family protein [bacterium]
MPPIKLGIIGCGIAANKLHWTALQKIRDQFEITAVCNNTEPKAKAFAQKVGGVPYVLDYRELLQRPDIEAVDIALPIQLNCEIAKDSLSAGKHVIVEKPMAANRQQAQAMLEYEKRFEQVKMVAENFHYHKGFLRVRELIRGGIIGVPFAAFWDVFRRIDANNPYAQTQWRIEHEYPGGFVLDGGVHFIAALRLIFGDIIAGQAFTKSVNPNIGEIDSCSFQFETPGDVHGVLNLYFSVDGISKNQLVVLGKEGTLFLENTENLIVRKAEEVVLEETIDCDWGYREEFEDFFQAIRFGKPVEVSFAQAYRDLDVMISALESAKRWHDFRLGTKLLR